MPALPGHTSKQETGNNKKPLDRKTPIQVSDEPMSGLWHPDRRDLLALVVSDRPLSVLRQGLEDQPETLPQPGFGYSLARQIGKRA
jgi:hypothetical protein